MSSESHPWHINTFSSGANYDGNIELHFSEQGKGVFIDARNAEPVSNDGNTGALEKIKGEVLFYDNSRNDVGYKCIGSEAVGEKIIEFWAPTNPLFPGIVRINGVVVLSSVDFQIRPDYPLQWGKKESENFNEIAITDRRIPPFVFDLEDMEDSLVSDPQKYFNDFDPTLYQINLQSALDIPVFVEMVNVGGGGGLAVGQYQYQMRYSSTEGDRTRWSHPTPMIPVGQSLSNDSEMYPWAKTYGGPSNPESVTAFAPKLRFRVTNLYNYDFIEIKRIPYNANAGIDFTPNGTIVAKIAVEPGEISVREYIDPAESNTSIPISETDETQQLAQVENCQSLRYFDRRLVLFNVKLVSKETNLTFLTIDDQEGFPVIDKIYKEGHKDPWNHTYRRGYMRKEKYGFAAVCYDGVGTPGFADKIPTLKNYEFPTRRDPLSALSNNYSLNGAVVAANSSISTIGNTHEVFDHYDSRWKSNNCDFKNIIQRGRVAGFTGTKTKTAVKQDCDETSEEIENHGAEVTAGTTVSVSYQPFHPTGKSDSDTSGHNYVVNTRVATDNPGTGHITNEDSNPDVEDYRPDCMSPDYYSMGMMIAGIDNFPSWAKSFAIVRTEAAKQVLCQGIGFYSLTKAKFKAIGSGSLGGKETKKLWFYSPDIDHGIVSSEVLNDIIDNPQNYKLQFSSPLGFFSEWYSAEDNLFASKRDRCIDMISYVRMLRDNADPSNINPGEDINMGIPDGGGLNYVTYDKYRNTGQSPNAFIGQPGAGNRIVNLSSARRVSEGRGNYIELESDIDIYGAPNTGGNPNFDDQGMKDWTEPIYIVNIIRTGANILDKDTQGYKQTTHYQKLESIIGKSTGIAGQKFQLVDERWEDCIPAPKSTQWPATFDRYLYVKLPSGQVQKWINTTYKTGAQESAIINGIVFQTNGLSGVYKHTNINNQDRFFEINFYHNSYIPPADSLIIVKYDNDAPIRVYGGDTFIGETIFAPLDKQASAKEDEAETQFAFGIGLPYKDFKINPRYYTIRKAGAAVNAIQDSEWFTLGFLRQLCAMFTVESRIACHLAHNLDSPNQFFPLTHYVIRPNRWDIEKGTVDNHVYAEYDSDYPGERDNWKWGGFRFLQQINPDYSVEPRIAFFSKPQFGFVEKTEFRTRVMNSLPRAINAQNAPGLKTFPANNSFDIDDGSGEIKASWDSNSDRGQNLYAITESGVCLLVTRKTILSDLGGSDIGQIASDSFIKQQVWITKDVGMPDYFWRGKAEGYVPLTSENGSEVRQEALFFPNKESIFMLMNNVVKDIGRINYHSRLYLDGLSKVLDGQGTHMTAIFNKYKQQYWLHLKNEGEDSDLDTTFVFGKKTDSWYGTNDFKFDRFTVRGNQIFGHRDMQTFELGVGYTINGSPVIFEVLTAAAPEFPFDKEFIAIKINSPEDQKPVRVEFYKEKNGTTQCFMDSSFGPAYLKNYRGWTNYIGRILASVNPSRPRFQDRLIIYKILHNLASEFKVVDSSIQYKKLKIR